MNPSSEQIRFVELTSLQDDLLLPWLDLYETAFPAAERVLVSKHLLALKGASDADEPGEHHILAALAGNASFAGLARYQVVPDLGVAYLWYLATSPELRSQGVGTKFYQEIVRRVAGPAVRTLAIEVEMPARASGGEGAAAAAEKSAVSAERALAERALAQRRITFYRRQGARLLEGIHYLQSVGRHQAPIPMHLMFHAFGALDAAQAFALARSLWGEQVKQVGELRLA
jgi:GNAT superfamily N-acetyltransferase